MLIVEFRIKNHDAPVVLSYIFFSRALHGRSFHELALELDLGYQGVAAAYHRVCKKVKEATGRDVK